MRQRWTQLLQVMVEDVAAALFPSTCRSCGTEQSETDPDPDLGLGRLRRSLGGPFSLPLFFLCAACATRIRSSDTTSVLTGTDRVGCLSAFEPGPELFQLIHAFKYEGATELGPWLGERLTVVVQRWIDKEVATLIPVPLHPSRLAVRGYNQSALLAHEVADRLALPCAEHLLERSRPTSPQASLVPEQRPANVDGAFRARGRVPDRGWLVLVDDVVTSGSTARAALEALGPCMHRMVVLTLCTAHDSATGSP